MEEVPQLMETGFGLELITPKAAEELSRISREIYVQYYLYLWHDAGHWYQQMRYNAATLGEELSSPLTEFYWIRQGEQKAGYIKINLDIQPPECEACATKGLEIERIYLYKEFAGKRLGQQAMAWVEEQAKQGGYDFLFLYTMDSSDARTFYEKMGYQKAAEKRLPFEQMKPEYRGMYLMTKELR